VSGAVIGLVLDVGPFELAEVENDGLWGMRRWWSCGTSGNPVGTGRTEMIRKLALLDC
jgi:hypothetical protein